MKKKKYAKKVQQTITEVENLLIINNSINSIMKIINNIIKF